jgi:hypothetical protein
LKSKCDSNGERTVNAGFWRSSIKRKQHSPFVRRRVTLCSSTFLSVIHQHHPCTGHKVLAYFFSSLVCIFNFKIHLHSKPFCILISRGNLSSKKIFLPPFSSHYTRILPPIIYIINFYQVKTPFFVPQLTELLCYSSPVLPLILFSRFFPERLYRFHLLKKRKREKNTNKCYILVYIALYSINIIY